MQTTPGCRRRRVERSPGHPRLGSTALCVLFALAALAALSACDSTASRTFVAPATARCAVEARATPTTFPAAGGSGTLAITTARECAWTAQSSAGWIAMAPDARGQGDGSVRFTIGANADPDGRAGRLTAGEVEMAISQDGQPCSFTLSSTYETVASAGGHRTIDVQASHARCTWSVVSGTPWIEIDGPSSRTGSGEVSVDIALGPPESRTGTIAVAGHTVTIEQAVGQTSCTAVPSMTTQLTGRGGGRIEIPVTSPDGCPWSARSDTAWITIAGPGTARGSAVVLLDVSPNPGPARNAVITIAGQSIHVQQTSGCEVVPQVTSASVGSAGGPISIAVQAAAGCDWTAQSEASWMSIASGGNGSGPGTVVVAAAASDGPARTGVVRVAGLPVTVAQSSGCRYLVQPSSLAAAAAGLASGVTLQTAPGCPWTASSADPWITLPTLAPAGPAAVPVVVAANTGPPRTGTFTVAGTQVTVAQESACTWQLAPPSADYPADGGRGAILVLVTGPCTWTSASTASWISLDSGAAGTGDGLVQFTVAANPGAARSGVVRIGTLDLVVRQASR